MIQQQRGNNKGLIWWIIQRVSAIILLALLVYIGYWIATTETITYENYKAFLERTTLAVLGFFAAFAVVLHGVYGIWAVMTDYMNERTGGKLLYAMWPYLFGFCTLMGLVALIWTLKLVTGV